MKKYSISGVFLLLVILAYIIPSPNLRLIDDKILHVVCFFVGSVLLFYMLDIKRKYMFFSLFIGLGIGLEFIHGVLPYRDFELLDIIANILGVLGGIVTTTIIKEKICVE
jgi:VanZ family protein